MVTPRITNKLRGSLGEIYYKEFCDQEGWAYTSLENIYESMNHEWEFTFKKGFHRIKVPIPEKIREEVKMLIKPTNHSKTSPSFVFDFLACNVKKYREYSKVNSDMFFTWVESKTGNMIFSGSQIKTMSKIDLPLAIFHIEDILAKPRDIRMMYDLKSGKEWLKELVPIENELYEFA
ncbi:MAG: hypothetical protein HOD60_07420 [Candidatus Nitrosopelagicus sp.]|nr:hypothetical protein [Candidatus Nitrosopelagicus sp.]